MARVSFTEYEAFAEAVQDASVRMRIPSLEEPHWMLQYATVGSLRIQQGYEGGGNIAEGATVSDGWTFFHQHSPSRPGRANGQETTVDDVFAVPPSGEFCLASQLSHEWIMVVVPPSLLFHTDPEYERASIASPHLLKPPPRVTRQFMSLVSRFLSVAESKPLLLDSHAAVESFRNEFLATTRELFATSEASSSRNFVRWRRQTMTTIELAENQSDRLLTVPDLAQDSGVAERTLRTAFRKCYGLSPVEYLRIRRLHEARRLLRASCPDETTVTRVAFSLGFWDLGRFAGAYRLLFGELPSRTLRNSSVRYRRMDFVAVVSRPNPRHSQSRR
ncbi:helix-turn-helix domain-containing protein [Planctomycetaceae bacterium SH139]